MRARSSVGFHLLRSFQAPSRLVRLFFLFDFFFRAALLLAREGSHSGMAPARLLGIFPTLLPFDRLATAAAVAAAALAVPEEELCGDAAAAVVEGPVSIGGADLGVSGCPEGNPSVEVCVVDPPTWLEEEGPWTGTEEGVVAPEGDTTSGDWPTGGEAATSAPPDPGMAMPGAVSTISSSKRLRLMARELRTSRKEFNKAECSRYTYYS